MCALTIPRLVPPKEEEWIKYNVAFEMENDHNIPLRPNSGTTAVAVSFCWFGFVCIQNSHKMKTNSFEGNSVETCHQLQNADRLLRYFLI